MKTPKHDITPNDWPQTENIIHEIDIEISEIKSQITSNISAVSATIDSQLSAATAGLGSELNAVSQHVSQVDSQLLLIESEAASNDSEILLLESEIADAESELDLVSEAVVAVESDLLVEKSTVATVSQGLSACESDLLVEKSTVNAVSELLSQVDSQLLLIESEAASNDSEILLLESECASNDSEILLLESECNDISEALSQTDSEILILTTNHPHQDVQTSASPTFVNISASGNLILGTGSLILGGSAPNADFYHDGTNLILDLNGYFYINSLNPGYSANVFFNAPTGRDASFIFQDNSSNKWLVGYDNNPPGFRVYNYFQARPEMFFPQAGGVNIGNNNSKLSLGAIATNFQLYSDGTDARIDYTGDLKFNGTAIDGWIESVESEVSNASARITAVDSQLLLIESEAESNDSEILLIESECATNSANIVAAESELDLVSEGLSACESDLLVEKSTVNDISEVLSQTISDNLIEKSTLNDVSELLSQLDSQLLLIESEAESNDSEILLLESRMSAVEADHDGFVDRGDESNWDYKLKKEEGSATSTSANHLVDSAATFETNGVAIDDYVFNTTDSTWAQVTAVNSENDLTLDTDIMVNGENYYVGSFKTDGSNHTLDMSSIIPSNATSVLLRTNMQDSVSDQFFRVKRSDYTTWLQAFLFRTQVANVSVYITGVTSCNTARTFTYSTSNGQFDILRLQVCGWWVR